MNEPVLAFRSGRPHTRQLEQKIARLRRERPDVLAWIERGVDLYLGPERQNIAKPVITIETNDREGA